MRTSAEAAAARTDAAMEGGLFMLEEALSRIRETDTEAIYS